MLLSLLHVFVFFACMFVTQGGLELTVAHASLELVSGLLVLSSLVLGLQMWATRPCSEYVLNLLVLGLIVINPGVTHLHL